MVLAAHAAALPVDTKVLTAELEALQHAQRIPAFGLVVLQREAPPWIWAAGRSGNPESPNVDTATPLRLGSITKTFTALALAELLAARGIDFATPLETIVGPGTHDNPFTAQPVRLRHLTEHTAGLGDLSRKEFDYVGAPLSLAAAFALDPSSRRVWWPPGTRHAYSNVTPGLAALAIEKLSGETYEAFTTRTVLRPFGMPTADFFPLTELARGYRDDGITEIPYWQMTFRAYGALNASVAEMASFLRVLLDEGRRGNVLADATRHDLRRPTTTLAAAVGLEIGYGLGMYGWVRHGHVFWGHGGDADGYRSRYGLLPAAGRAYFVIINADNPAALERMRALIEARLTQDLRAPAAPPVPRLSAAELARWEGAYYPSSARFRLDEWRNRHLPTVRVAVVDGGLRLSKRADARSDIRLFAVNDHLFRRETDPQATVAFIGAPEAREGCVHLQGELGNFVKIDPNRGQAFQNRCIWE